MGALWCCFRVKDGNERAASTESSNANCFDNLLRYIETKDEAAFPLHVAPSSDSSRVLQSNPPANSRVEPKPSGEKIIHLIPKKCQKPSSVTDSSHAFRDVHECPTCLEEYTMENPKIVTKCQHHYHLSCIFEWMERSKDCPVCGKKMEFEEHI